MKYLVSCYPVIPDLIRDLSNVEIMRNPDRSRVKHGMTEKEAHMTEREARDDKVENVG